MASPAPDSEPNFSPSASFGQSYAGTHDEDYSFQSDEPSQAYPVEEAEGDVSLSSATSDHSVDSLANASFSEVEARALEFLGSSPPSDAPVSLAAGNLDFLASFPRKLPSSPTEQDAGRAKAVEFLRSKLDEAERDDWRYPAPPVFGPPPPLGLRQSSDEQLEPGGTAASTADQAFNLERHNVDGLVAVDEAEIGWVQEDPMAYGSGLGDEVGAGGWDS
ncbi:hypothetical protein JCM10207_007888 [Rhodosporidiobolus poonsookiae]